MHKNFISRDKNSKISIFVASPKQLETNECTPILDTYAGDFHNLVLMGVKGKIV